MLDKMRLERDKALLESQMLLGQLKEVKWELAMAKAEASEKCNSLKTRVEFLSEVLSVV